MPPPRRLLEGGEQSDQFHCDGGARSGTRGGFGKIVASEDFASFFIHVFVRAKFFFPTVYISILVNNS
jgi:hypothetical protein